MPDDDLPDDSELPQVDDSGQVTGGSSNFGQWFQQHQRAVFIIGGITLLLTVYLIFRKSGSSGTTTGVPSGATGPAQPGMTSDTAAALNQQTTLLEALANAVANLQKQQVPPNPGPVPNPGPAGFSPDFLAFLQGLPSAAQQQLLTLWSSLTQQQQQQFEALPLAQQEAWVTQQIQGLQTITPPQVGPGPGGVNPPGSQGPPGMPPGMPPGVKVPSGFAASASLPMTNGLHWPTGIAFPQPFTQPPGGSFMNPLQGPVAGRL